MKWYEMRVVGYNGYIFTLKNIEFWNKYSLKISFNLHKSKCGHEAVW